MDHEIALAILEDREPTLQERLRHETMLDEYVCVRYRRRVLNEAADEIDRLCAEVARLKRGE